MEEDLPLVIHDLTKYYEATAAVSKVSFKIYPGEIFGLLGPNGAGKTTIISTIMTLKKQDEGVIKVFGKNTLFDSRFTRSMIGYVPQELISHGYFNVEEIIKFHATYYGMSTKSSHIQFLLKKLGLFEHRKKQVNKLSGGMKRRLLIIKALLHKPKVILLDEPTAGVDLELRNNLWDFIKHLKKENIAILLTTHYLEEAEILCDRVAILQKGILKKIDKTGNLIKQLTFRKIKILLNHPIKKIEDSTVKSQTDCLIEIEVAKHKKLSEVLKNLNLKIDDIKDLYIEEGKLEDVIKNVLFEKN